MEKVGTARRRWNAPQRVDLVLSAKGYGARSAVQAWCDQGRVAWRGKRVASGSERVVAREVTLDGARLEFPESLAVLFYKPRGYVCSTDAAEGPRVYDLLPPRWLQRNPRVTTAGRLDKDSSGLLVVTDDGALVHRLTSPAAHLDKEYRVTLDDNVTQATVAAFERGIALDGEERLTRPARLVATADRTATVTLNEGRYRQVRRMFAACGLYVQTLVRVRLGEWTIDSLEPGTWRELDSAG